MRGESGVVTRRSFLKAGAAGAAVAATGRPLLGAEAGKKRIRVGMQRYSLRRECKSEFVKVLGELAKMGYEGVEFAGYYGWDRKPAEFRKLLDDHGLACCGTHTHIGTLLGASLQKTIALHKTLGNRFLMVPSLPGQYRKGKQGWLKTAKLFSDIAARAKPQGMVVGYHNHSVEFKPIDGEVPWDILFGAAGPDVAMQLDIGNCMGGGGDPVHFLRKYAARAWTIHLKESGGGDGVVGQGKAPWKEIFAIARTQAVTEWHIVEFGGSKLGNLECARRSLEFIKQANA